ncbi:MAG: hypothetical protein KKA36_01630 [Gammaproteobacteria bacterium]|nr:hypothetical protein [Gammaproteobacteria bacterium]MBU2477762.1 hypothetical protein [Gammaproteobacteria bacterium]
MVRAAKYILVLIVIGMLLAVRSNAVAESPLPGEEALWFNPDTSGPPSVSLYFFWSNHCPHCLEARPFIKSLQDRYPWLELHSYELYDQPENRIRYLKMADLLKVQAGSVPAFMLCGKMYTGWGGDDVGGKFIEQELLECYQQMYENKPPLQVREKHDQTQLMLSGLPLLGELEAGQFSLPVLTLLLAGMDAFNPCAFFVLLFLLSLMVHQRSRRRMLFIGTVFVLVSGLVYFAFMAAWLNVFLLFGEIRAVTMAAGSVAIVMALISIKDYFRLREGISLSLSDGQKQSLFQRGRNLLKAGNMSALLVGTVLLAMAANMYELLCTAGFPMVYTRILTLNDLSAEQYYLYLALYNVIYVIPLLLIVMLFAITLGSRKLKESEGRFLKLLSGGMMLGLGIILLIAPERLNNLATALMLFAAAFLFSFMVVGFGRVAKLPPGQR